MIISNDIIFSVLCAMLIGVGMANGKKKDEKTRFGVVKLQHENFRCLGALLSPQVIFTCCTCVSDVIFDQFEGGDTGYQMRALAPDGFTIHAGNQEVTASEVCIHPQCDIDGTYDYGIVKTDKCLVENDCLYRHYVEKIWFNNERLMSRYRHDPQNPKQQSKSLQKTGTCVLVTALEMDRLDAKLFNVPTKFVDWSSCWNGSETKPVTDSKYCVMSLDGTAITEAKCGSPVYCNDLLVGVLARRYAIGGRQFASVNGVNGAVDFVKETADLDLETGLDLSGNDDNGSDDFKSKGGNVENRFFGKKRMSKWNPLHG